MNGILTLILTAHVPYVRSSGRLPIGEDVLHETIAYSLVPTLNLLCDLSDLRVRPQLALAYSPLLLEQLADPVVQKHFMLWMNRWIEYAEAEQIRCLRRDDTHRAYLMRFYVEWGQNILTSFIERHGRNLTAVLRHLAEEGLIEVLSGAATHPYLPLLGRMEAVRAQLDIGKIALSHRLGRQPRGLWLPECGYHPALESAILASESRYIIADPSSTAGELPITPLRPRWIAPRRLSALIRHEGASQQAWSFDLGYPGDSLYLAPQRDAESGFACWSRGSDPSGAEMLYDPYHAFQRVHAHAAHFLAYVTAELEAFQQRHDRPGVVVLPLDAELIGRHWFEGPAWLQAVIEQFVTNSSISLTGPSAYLRAYRPRQGVQLREGGWGEGGDSRAWASSAALPLWDAIHTAEVQVVQLARRYRESANVRERVLNQAARELLLAQSSDWMLLLGQGHATSEAQRRPMQHLQRCERLCALAERDELTLGDLAFLEEVEELDNPFPGLNYRVFAPA